MGREIRRVPPRWEHPKRMYPNHQAGRMEEGYQPLYDQDFESAMQEWLEELSAWLHGGFAKVKAEHPDIERRDDEPYREFCEWHGDPPDKDYYRPKWDESAATHYQMYETVSEGTPVSPVFATKEELVEYLVEGGDFSDRDDNRGGWDRKAAESFVGRGFAMSLMMTRTGDKVEIKEPRDGIM